MTREAWNQKAPEYYDRAGWALLSGIAELLDRCDILAGRRLLFVADVRRQASGSWLVEQFELSGDTPRRLESVILPSDSPARQLPQPGRLYLWGPYSPEQTRSLTEIRPLHPWVIFQPEGNEVFFLNGHGGWGEVEHLCYTTGRILTDIPIEKDRHPLLARFLGDPVVAETANIRAEVSRHEEPVGLAETSPRHRPRLGEFELMSCLGRGGMGMVFRAWHLPLRRQVGLKCMLRSGDPKSESRFAREIRALGRVDHPHLVKIYSSGTEGDQQYYAMELVEGTDLATVCRQLQSSTGSNPKLADWDRAIAAACQATRNRERSFNTDTDANGPSTTVSMKIEVGPDGAAPATAETIAAPAASRPPDSTPRRSGVSHSRPHSRKYVDRVVEALRQVAEATHALHEANIVHRDIKPGNIMLTADGGQAVLMDLGLAQLADETEGRLTHTLDYVGTLKYSSPEQLRAAHHVDRRTDIYSLGATLWELLTLQPLFGAGKTTSPARLMLDIQSSDPGRLRHWNPRIPPDLEIIVLKCLEKSPARRYSTARELADDLRRWQRNLPVQAQPPTLRYVLGKHIRRHRLLLSTLAALIFAAVLVGSWSVYQINRAREEALAALARETQAHQEASRYFQEARAISDRTLENLSDLLRHFPDAQTRGVQLIDETLASYRRLAAEKPADRDLNLEWATARFHAAKAYENLGLLDKSQRECLAVERQLEALRLGEGEADWRWLQDQSRIHRGRVLAELGRAKQAQACFAAASRSLNSSFESDPSRRTQAAQAQLSIEWGRLLMRQNQLAKAQSRFDQAVKTFEELLAAQPQPSFREGLASALTDRGRLLVRQGQHESAAAAIRQAIEQLSNLEKTENSTSVRETKGFALVALGNALRPLGDDAARLAAYREALAYYQALLEVYPNAPRLLRTWAISATNLAYVLHKLGRNQEAYRFTEQALEVSQALRRGRQLAWEDGLQEAAGLTLAAEILHHLHKLQEAEQVFARVLEMLPPQDPDQSPDALMSERRGLALCGRGRVLHALRRDAEAETALLQGIEELKTAKLQHPHPAQVAEHLAWASAALGDVYFQTGRADAAAAQYEIVLKIRGPLSSPEQLHDLACFLTMCCDPKICAGDGLRIVREGPGQNSAEPPLFGRVRLGLSAKRAARRRQSPFGSRRSLFLKQRSPSVSLSLPCAGASAAGRDGGGSEGLPDSPRFALDGPEHWRPASPTFGATGRTSPRFQRPLADPQTPPRLPDRIFNAKIKQLYRLAPIQE